MIWVEWRRFTGFAALLLALWLGFGADAHAELRALLIGVSGYPNLPERLRLTGPRNDVQRLRQVLLTRGFRGERIEVLADSLAGAAEPTRANILGALNRLAAQAERGDVVFIHFAGHGSQQPAPGVRPGQLALDGSPGLEATILPLDIGRWDREQRSVANAIRASELRDAADRITARGAFLWAVFDSCHSARLVRSTEAGSVLRYRHVAASDLGVPQPEMERAMASDATRGASPTAGSGLPPSSAAAGGGVSALFYATQAHEVTPELALPVGKPGAKVHGLFGFVVAQALERVQPMTYRQLTQYILAEYGALVDARATPLFAGNGLDTFVLDQRSEQRRQWPLQVDARGLALPAGSLSGIGPGAVLAVLPNAVASSSEILGYLSVTSAQTDRADLAPIGHAGRSAPAQASLRAGQFVRLVSAPMEFDLRVAVDRNGSCAGRCALSDAVARLRQDGVPGVAALWVDAAAEADVVLEQIGSRVVFLPPTRRADDLRTRSAAPGLAIGDNSQALANRVATGLHVVARSRNLLRVASRLLTQAPAIGLAAELQVDRAGVGRAEAVAAGTTPTLKHGDRLVLSIGNKGQAALDVTVLYLDADHGVSGLYPNRAGETNRLDPGARTVPIEVDIRVPPAGIERVMIIAVQATKLGEQRDYSFLQQAPLARRGAAASAESDAFADAAFADYRTRGAQSPALPAPATAVQLFTFAVQP